MKKIIYLCTATFLLSSCTSIGVKGICNLNIVSQETSIQVKNKKIINNSTLTSVFKSYFGDQKPN